ncbi:head completion/stabilization protein [Achromobacter sp. UMC71]|uniref:head completion/stabilization protein n=1 Tax=Achromobacter sp. UMC71 TaxID=1862320 RepID=UPI001602F806|nr:head completion/stabilization protein [Achromobacter sp. UMC71]MBB1625173.1 hypothetical protein [Achromobacter sp. UMC71]
MSFIANQPAPVAANDTITNDGFWPDVKVSAARKTLRLDGTVTDERVRHALIAAIIEVARDVTAWRLLRQAEGFATLSAVPGPKVDGASVAEHSYLRAVYAYTKADLVERMADFDLTGAGQKKAEWLDATPDEQRRNAAWAIAALVGRSRCTVDLV